MDPKEFNWKAEQQVVVTNPTSKNFRFQVHSKWYEVGSAQTVKMPGFIAWSYVYKMAVGMAITDKNFKKWNEDGVHQTYYDKIVVSVEEVIQQVSTVEEAVTTFNAEDLDDDSLDDNGESDESDEDSGDDESDQGSDSEQPIKSMERKHGRSAKNRKR